MIYIPLVTLFTVLILLISLHTIHASYLSPRIKLMTFSDAPNRDSENTYYERDCTASDISTIDPSDLAIHPNSTASEALHHMMKNGMSVYPDILSPDTSTRLRDYIIKRNSELTKEEAIPVIANENRWSFGIGVNDDPIVTEAVREVATNRLVRGGLEAIAGRNPALVEFTAISTAFGATDQFWHQDVLASGSALKYSRSFIPTYNLFISLQVRLSLTSRSTFTCVRIPYLGVLCFTTRTRLILYMLYLSIFISSPSPRIRQQRWAQHKYAPEHTSAHPCPKHYSPNMDSK